LLYLVYNKSKKNKFLLIIRVFVIVYKSKFIDNVNIINLKIFIPVCMLIIL
jgi:hypothetical protein